MIKYREHRGGLDESLKSSMEFNTIKQLLDFIILQIAPYGEFIKLGDTKIGYYCYDKRVNQELYVVSADGYGVFGFIYEEDDK